MIRAVLLDVDGTLVRSNNAHARAWSDAFNAFGYRIRAARILPLIGMGGEKILATLTPGLSPEHGLGLAIAQRRSHIFLDCYAPGLEPTPGARALIEALHERGDALIVASSAKDEELQTLLRAAQVDDLIALAATSDDAQRSKPAPDIIRAAIEKARVDPTFCTMLGDTPYDILAAHRAGVPIVALTCGGWPREELRDAEEVYRDPADVLAQLHQSALTQRVEPAGVRTRR